ncbi:hypothetical protein QJS04_geneDACA016491 [Acorus gramineus]|uniref:Uncharacterized protein n=1 Tax=Acorus gramineus TaxID=55184 RepID=A0AAV9BD02_ACOGR|nr:hypothetical protein QJS04_geneDACA016491 [Acorus gramineus]
MLKGPGFNENFHFVNGTFMGSVGNTLAINLPKGSTKICMQVVEMMIKFCRKFRICNMKARKRHEEIPNTHVRNVNVGNVLSSVIGMVRRTSSMGDSSISSAKCTYIVASTVFI